jgi:integrase
MTALALPQSVDAEHPAVRPVALATAEPQAERLADAAGEYGDVVQLLAYTGLRIGEMAALRVRRVDFLRKRLTVAESATEVGGTVEYGTPKTHQQRTVPIPGVLVEPLSRRCQGKGPDDLVLTSPGGAVLHSGNFRRRFFDRAARAAGLEDLSPHDLRHTAASLLMASGANVKAVQRMLDNASVTMTLDVYSELFDDDLGALADRIDAAHQASVTNRHGASCGHRVGTGLHRQDRRSNSELLTCTNTGGGGWGPNPRPRDCECSRSVRCAQL